MININNDIHVSYWRITMNKQQMDQVRELLKMNMELFKSLGPNDYVPQGTDGLTSQQYRMFDMEMDRFTAQKGK